MLMDTVGFLSKSRGYKNLSLRIVSIVRRFGVGARKFEKLLLRFGALTKSLGCRPTFAITAVTLKRHPRAIRELCRLGVEFMVHGYIHTDYAVVPPEEQKRHFARAMRVFKSCRVPFSGFRAPFLRTNPTTQPVLANLGFPFDSSHSLYWDVVEPDGDFPGTWSEYERLLEFYQARPAAEYLSLPHIYNGILELPVSLPDDEALVERLGITHKWAISAVWRDMLQKSHERGELFIIQLHPERIRLCEAALNDCIEQGKRLSPSVWTASLQEITEWWGEKQGFGWEIDEARPGRYRIKATCSDRASILVKNGLPDCPTQSWDDSYQLVPQREFVMESPVLPVIGLDEQAPLALSEFLLQEGYAVERTEHPERCSVFLGNIDSFTRADEKPLVERLDAVATPLVRFWRWPEKAKSAMAVTGDIDSITLVDFAWRVLENWQQGRKEPYQPGSNHDRNSNFAG